MKVRIIFLAAAVLSAQFLTSCSTGPSASGSSERTSAAQGTSIISTSAGTEASTPTAESSATEPEQTSTGADTSYEARAKEILQGMSLEEKVGQMFFVRCPETDGVTAVSTWHPGGYILFGRDFDGKTVQQVIDQNAAYQSASSIPMLIGVDEEGGTVVRISQYNQFRPEKFKSPQSLFAGGGLDLIKSDTDEKSDFLLHVGVNVNLAPVCDVSMSPDDFIYARSFGMPAEGTAAYVSTVTQEMVSHRIGCVLKHFPGYGNNVDTHTGIAFDNRSYDTFVTSDFLPFTAGIGAGAGAIMVAHNVVACMDANLPASLSLPVHEILRKDLGFTGVIMTDDLDMDAIKDYTGGKEAAVMAVLAGNDMIISTDFEVQIPAVLAAVNSGEIAKANIDESVLRILVWKLSLGIVS